jgi:hypothetical protein
MDDVLMISAMPLVRAGSSDRLKEIVGSHLKQPEV